MLRIPKTSDSRRKKSNSKAERTMQNIGCSANSPTNLLLQSLHFSGLGTAGGLGKAVIDATEYIGGEIRAPNMCLLGVVGRPSIRDLIWWTERSTEAAHVFPNDNQRLHCFTGSPSLFCLVVMRCN